MGTNEFAGDFRKMVHAAGSMWASTPMDPTCDIEKRHPDGWRFFHDWQHSFSSPAYRDVLKGIRTKLPANEHHGKVVDVCAGCAGDDEAADLFERVIRIVLL